MDSSGKTLIGKTTDNNSIQVCLSDPVSSPINGWVKVIGEATANDRINCQYSNFCCLMDWTRVVIQFEHTDGDEAFDTDSYDMLVNNCDDVYKSS